MRPTGKLSKTAFIYCSTLLVSLLAACGGGGSGSSSFGVTAAPAATVTISGTAATGAPIPGGAVNARCQGGTTATTVTQANGNFSMSVVVGAMPCAIQVTPPGGGQVLYSVASGTSTTVTANITPLTSLALALSVNATTAQTLDAWFASVSSLPAVATALVNAQATLRSTLVAAGYTVPNPFNPITTSFSPAAGNIYDDLLEAIAAAIRASGGSFAATQASFVAGGGTALPAPSPTTSTPTTPTPTTPANGLGSTVTATLNAALLGTYTKAFYVGGGAGCGTACSYTDGQAVSFALVSGNILSLPGKTLSNPYFRVLFGSPHTPEIIWRDGNIEYALTDNDSGAFSEINVGDLSAPVNGFPKFLGQIRAVQQTGIVNVTQFAGTYAKGFQYYGPLTGGKAPTWTGLTIGSNGAITFTGGSGTGTGPSLTPAQIASTNDYLGCCGNVQVQSAVNTTVGDSVVDSFDSIRLYRNAAGQLSAVEYYVDGTDASGNGNFVGVLLGTPAALPAHSGAAIPTTNQVAGTANGTNYAIATTNAGAYSFASQGGFSQSAVVGSANTLQQWNINANRLGPLSVGTTFACQIQNTGTSNTDTKIVFQAGSNTYRSEAGGRCLITLTKVTTTGTGSNTVVTELEGTFTAELYTFKRDLAPLIVNDGVFRWLKP